MKVSKFHHSTSVAVLLLCLSACRPEQRPQPEPEYNVLTVQPSDQEIATSYSASIKGRQDIDILPQVGGFLTNVCVTEGQHVKKGQLLFVICLLYTSILIIAFSQPHCAALEFIVGSHHKQFVGARTGVKCAVLYARHILHQVAQDIDVSLKSGA